MQHGRWRLAPCVALLLLGASCLVGGSWIYAKAAVAQLLLRRAWSAIRAGDARARPWPWADTWPIARLLSPMRRVDLVVLEGATGSSTAFGPGHILGTASPGEPGNVALAAHRDTHFRFLRDLAPGEPLWLELPDGRLLAYAVESARVVDERDTRLLQTPGSWLTLVTCYPFDAAVPGGPLRYVVQARPTLSTLPARPGPGAS
jgi:sortase A